MSLFCFRAVWFLREVFYELTTSKSPSANCITASYQRTLRQYHNWVIRGIFSLALGSLPAKESFLMSLATDVDEYWRDPKEFERAVCTRTIQIQMYILENKLD